MALLPHILWAGVHRSQIARLAENAPRRSALHRTRLAVRERLSRIIQWENAGPVSQGRAVLYTEGSADSDGALADPRQHGPSAQQSRGPATRSRNLPACELKAHMVGGTKTPGWSMRFT